MPAPNKNKTHKLFLKPYQVKQISRCFLVLHFNLYTIIHHSFRYFGRFT